MSTEADAAIFAQLSICIVSIYTYSDIYSNVIMKDKLWHLLLCEIDNRTVRRVAVVSLSKCIIEDAMIDDRMIRMAPRRFFIIV